MDIKPFDEAILKIFKHAETDLHTCVCGHGIVGSKYPEVISEIVTEVNLRLMSVPDLIKGHDDNDELDRLNKFLITLAMADKSSLSMKLLALKKYLSTYDNNGNE